MTSACRLVPPVASGNRVGFVPHRDMAGTGTTGRILGGLSSEVAVQRRDAAIESGADWWLRAVARMRRPATAQA
jgi:hypothetical protein